MLQTKQNEPDQAAIDAVNLSRIRAAKASYSSENGAYRSVCAKAQLQHLHLPAAKRALKAFDSGKVDEMIEEFERTIFYLKLLGKPVSTEQLELFDGLTQSAPEDEKAGLEGRAAGLAGDVEASNPYDAGSPKGQAWLTSYREAKSERELVLSMPEPDVESDDEDGEDE